MKRSINACAVLFLLLLFFPTAPGLFAEPSELGKLSLEELMELEVTPVVTSVSRRSEKVSKTPAAVFVITAEDIRRSGATSIPELLRLAPGLSVSRIDGSKWAVSARGSDNRFFGNLLVLIDGRNVYSPLFSGVYWDVQDTLLEDIERIEVVRGPGGTTWGANAVNGVINIVTKSAYATQNGMISFGSGTYDGTDIGYRYGGPLEGNGAFRFFFKTYDRRAFRTPSVNQSVDNSEQSRFGLRFDWEPSSSRKLTIDATVYGGMSHELLYKSGAKTSWNTSAKTSETDVSGGHFRFLLLQSLRNDEEFRLQLYFDRARRYDGNHGEAIDTFDLDMQHQFSPWKSHELVWGIGYRQLQYNLQGGARTSFDPDSDNNGVQSCFVQDQITLEPRHLFLTVGTKIYHHPYVGTEGQPSARLLWTPRERHVFWTAWTEAKRIPSISERVGRMIRNVPGRNGEDTTLIESVGNSSLHSETMRAKEVGYRFLPNPKVSFDLAYFRQDYCQLARSVNVESPASSSIPQQGPTNTGELAVHGLELSLQWKPLSNLRVAAGHTVNWQLRRSSSESQGFLPRQWFVRTYWDFRKDMECDLSFQHKDKSDRSSGDMRSTPAPAYNSLNARIGWRPNKFFELSVGGQYLTLPWHTEFATQNDYYSSEIPRNYYLKATWSF
ncbi:MAG: TonB-dependent receptor plug domain-containing protein [Candidatus Ozemobacteraceae bacterium]